MNDYGRGRPKGLDRFKEPQNRVFGTVLDELRRGRKDTHWMWFIFPQLKGIGTSNIAQFYGLNGMQEFEAYMADYLLHQRLILCVNLVCMHFREGRRPLQIFGDVDAMKLHSCVTLLSENVDLPRGHEALDLLFSGEPCPRTMELLMGRRIS